MSLILVSGDFIFFLSYIITLVIHSTWWIVPQLEHLSSNVFLSAFLLLTIQQIFLLFYNEWWYSASFCLTLPALLTPLGYWWGGFTLVGKIPHNPWGGKHLLFVQVISASLYHSYGAMWSTMNVWACEFLLLTPCSQRLPAIKFCRKWGWWEGKKRWVYKSVAWLLKVNGSS